MSGHLNLEEARPLDRKWWQKAQWILDWTENRLLSQTLDMRLRSRLAAIAVPDIDPALLKSHWEAAVAIQSAAERVWLPWIETGHNIAAVAVSMTDQWREVFGDERNPAVQEKIAATVAALRSRAAPKDGR